ncbi:hypothetical protein [Pedobacter xixiisoli]|uniref:Uncharacterized protein n=1 Tax=Pedobacter xixiisoli TaxID=1476464 RepID=A0A285ZPS1_9SPHI|nr:hypothetical protein [Pedobacter xixiisoli]SOD11656.1 hypothetical protein SAMN06297358_0266 [Pedobacter xixiisoli]
MKASSELAIVIAAKRCARISLLLGISIFLAFAISKVEQVMIGAFFFILLACLTNGFILLILLLHLIGARSNWRQIFNAIIIMLINIPIGIFFVWLSIQIADLNHINL